MDTVKNPLIVTANPRPADPTAPLGRRSERTDGPDAQAAEDPDAPAPGMVKGPYAVETFPVDVQDGYLYLVVDVVDVSASALSRSELRATR
jgi:hypothetical protein